ERPVLARYREKTCTRAGRRLTADCTALLSLSSHSYRRVASATTLDDQSAVQSALTPLAYAYRQGFGFAIARTTSTRKLGNPSSRPPEGRGFRRNRQLPVSLAGLERGSDADGYRRRR